MNSRFLLAVATLAKNFLVAGSTGEGGGICIVFTGGGGRWRCGCGVLGSEGTGRKVGHLVGEGDNVGIHGGNLGPMLDHLHFCLAESFHDGGGGEAGGVLDREDHILVVGIQLWVGTISIIHPVLERAWGQEGRQL